MGAMWQDVESEFAELDSIARDDYLLAIAVSDKYRVARREREDAECKSDPLKRAKRNAAKSRHVKNKESWNKPFRDRRRARSRAYAAELTKAREAKRIALFYERGGVLPGLEDFVPKRMCARLEQKVDEVREKQRARMRKTRADGKRCESMPLLERCA